MLVPRKVWSRLFPNPGYYGWVIVGMGFLASVLTAPGQSFIVALYLDPMMADLDLSRIQISALFSFATLGAAACLPLVGRWADRFPSGPFLAVVFGLLGVTLAGLGSVRGVIGLSLGFFLLRLLAHGAVGLGTLTATVRWFRRYRGRTLATVGIGYSAGGVVFPGLVYLLLERVGWRVSLYVLAILYLLLVTPMIGYFMRERRESDGPIDGEARGGNVGGTNPATQVEEASFSLADATRMPVFWGLLVAISVIPAVHTAVIFHQVALFASVGWSDALVPTAFMVLSITAVVMSYATGLWLERVPTRFGLVLTLGLSASALMAIALPLRPLAGALTYAALLGLASGAHSSTRTILWPDYFGVESLGAVKGVVQAAMSGATALGPPVAAALVSADGSFRNATFFFAAVCTAGAVISLWLRKPVADSATGDDSHPRREGHESAA